MILFWALRQNHDNITGYGAIFNYEQSEIDARAAIHNASDSRLIAVVRLPFSAVDDFATSGWARISVMNVTIALAEQFVMETHRLEY